ncbi:MAG: cupin domain-containing protein [Anaerolinea sp.]|nr:cupin domain-containing protein [Anaerolinea sp.]
MIEPFATQVNFGTGVIDSVPHIITRRLSDMRRMYADPHTLEAQIAAHGDPLVYEVYPVELPEEAGQILHCTTIIYPGRVNDEYYMTKGHFHSKRDCGEVYLGLSGTGMLLLQLEDGTVRAVPMTPGTSAYVPPYWAHRTVNTGNEPFIFFAAWPGDAGHDYGTIEQTGFAQLLVDRGGVPTLVPNPRYP